MAHTDIKWLLAKYFIYLIKEGTDKLWQLIHRRSKSVLHLLSDRVWWNQFFQNGKLITVYRARISCIPMGRACISLRISVWTVTCIAISVPLLRIYKMASRQWKPEVSRCVSWAGQEPTHLFCFACFFPPIS